MDLRIDIVVLGATGFTGKYAVKNLAVLSKEPEYSDIRWGIAGRSQEKLQNLLSELEELDVEINKVPVLEFDIEKEDSLQEVTKKTKLIMNATGPNTLLSEPIVKACIQNGTHYLDISAELYHMLNIYRDFNKAAEDAGVLIIPSCGFATIPVAAGLIYLEKLFTGKLHTVECYTELGIPLRANIPINNALIHTGTFDSMVYEFKNFKKYEELKKETFPDIEPVPEELTKSFFHRSRGKCWYPYPGPERDVVEQSLRDLTKEGKSRYYFKMYTTMPLFIHFLVVVPIFFCYYYLCRSFGCFRKVLRSNAGIFTLGLVRKKGPSDKMRNDTKYSFTFYGKGWSSLERCDSTPDTSLTVKISGSDPGYTTTAKAFVTAALTLLNERSKMPKGGVLTTCTAYRDTQLVDNVIKNGIMIEVVDDTKHIK